MAVSMPLCFDSWLNVKLKSLNTDENVFGFYIKGILEGEESEDEKVEALEGILAEIFPNDGTSTSHSDTCKEIFSQWKIYQSAAMEEKMDKVAVDIQIARIMEQQAQCVVTPKNYTEEEKKLKQSILSQYAQVSDGEEEEDEEPEAVGADASEGKGLVRNTNALDVMQAEKEKKERLRQESQKKKDKDREEREKQKQLQQERKEKEKKRTQKSEKKR